MLSPVVRHVNNYFDRAVNSYDQNGVIQNQAGSQLIEILKTAKIFPHKIIDLGCGTGIVTQKLGQAFKPTCFYAIDIAEQLLLKTKERLQQQSIAVKFANFESFKFKNQQFDLAFSNLALQWSDNFQAVFRHIYSRLDIDGYIAFSIPLNKNFSVLPAELKNKYFSKAFILELLEKSGFKNLYSCDRFISLPFGSSATALKSIKAVGANYLHEKTHNYRVMRQFLKATANQTPFLLDYHIGFFLAQKIT